MTFIGLIFLGEENQETLVRLLSMKEGIHFGEKNISFGVVQKYLTQANLQFCVCGETELINRPFPTHTLLNM